VQAPSCIGQDRFDLSSDALLTWSGLYAGVASLVSHCDGRSPVATSTRPP